MIAVEASRPAVGFVPMMRVAVRVLLLALLSGLAGVGAHVAGGGALPTTCLALVGVAGFAGPATFLAQALATRHRSTWGAFLALGMGQLGIELVLQVNDRAVQGPLTTAAVHLLANVALGVMLVGTDRALADLASVLDRVLPRVHEVPRLPQVLRGPALVGTGRVAFSASCASSPRTLRGPPRRVVLH